MTIYQNASAKPHEPSSPAGELEKPPKPQLHPRIRCRSIITSSLDASLGGGLGAPRDLEGPGGHAKSCYTGIVTALKSAPRIPLSWRVEVARKQQVADHRKKACLRKAMLQVEVLLALSNRPMQHSRSAKKTKKTRFLGLLYTHPAETCLAQFGHAVLCFQLPSGSLAT